MNDEWLSAILFAGLTDEFQPFIMGLEANGATITGDLIMSKLLDYRNDSNQSTAFIAKKPGKKWKKRPRKCFNCGSTQHLANACDKPKAERNNDKSDKGDKSAKAAFIMCIEDKNKSDEEIDEECGEKESLVGFHSKSNKGE